MHAIYYVITALNYQELEVFSVLIVISPQRIVGNLYITKIVDNKTHVKHIVDLTFLKYFSSSYDGSEKFWHRTECYIHEASKVEQMTVTRAQLTDQRFHGGCETRDEDLGMHCLRYQ